MEMPIVLIDMDDTIVDYTGGMLKTLKPYVEIIMSNVEKESRHYDAFHSVEHKNVNLDRLDRDNFYTIMSQPDNYKLLVDLHSQPGYFYNLKPIPGSLDAIRTMFELGWYVFFCSHPNETSDTCHSDKARWLKDHLGMEACKNLILTQDKTLIYGHVLIDDKVNIKGLREPYWKHLLYTNPGNEDVTVTKPRLFDWTDDWKGKVTRLLN